MTEHQNRAWLALIHCTAYRLVLLSQFYITLQIHIKIHKLFNDNILFQAGIYAFQICLFTIHWTVKFHFPPAYVIYVCLEFEKNKNKKRIIYPKNHEKSVIYFLVNFGFCSTAQQQFLFLNTSCNYLSHKEVLWGYPVYNLRFHGHADLKKT